MHRLFPALLSLALFCHLAAATTTTTLHHTYDTPLAHPLGWVQTKTRAPPAATIHLHFLLKQSNVSELLTRLEQVSEPSSPLYGQHMTNHQVQQLTAPSTTALSTVHHYLGGQHHTQAATSNSDIIRFTTTIAQAETLLSCKYYEYVHQPTKRTAFRTPTYSLPLFVAAHVAAVTPTVSLYTVPTAKPVKPVKQRHTAAPGHPEELVNIPSTLRTLYGVNQTQGTTGQTKMAVTGFIQQLYSTSDYSEFQTQFLNATQMGYNVSTSQLTCKGDDGSPSFLGGTEAMLDAEYITALGSNISTEFWGFKGNGNDPGLWLKWMMLVANTSDVDVPKVFSCSYGEDEYTMANDYADRVNIEFVKAGVRGISILVASGDSGAANQNSKCPHNKMFTPKWPAASPYITSVGGTGGNGNWETAADLSSGGFSNRYSAPKWQKEAVASYLSSSKLPNKTKHSINNTKGRGFPDVSAQAIDFMVVASFIPMPVMGTSCSAPTFSGIVGLLNDLRAAANKSSLGFLNPLLYSKAGMASLNDITFGNGGGCYDGEDKDNGFPALVGWDGVTGLGTPNYPLLSKLVKGLP